jgi:hypothetical protein
MEQNVFKAVDTERRYLSSSAIVVSEQAVNFSSSHGTS